MKPTGEKRDMPPQSLITRMVRAARLDARLYEEVEADSTATWQALTVVVLVSLAIGTGAGLAGVFAWAGVWSVWGLLLGLIGSAVAWLLWSFIAYCLGARVLKGRKTSTTVGGLLRTIGFSASPGMLGLFSFIPVAGGVIFWGACLWVLVAAVVAVRQALDSGSGRAIVTCLASWSVSLLVIVSVVAALLASLVGGSCTFGSGLDNQLNSIVRPYRFSVLTWEFASLRHEFGQWFRGRPEDTDDAVRVVAEYFSGDEERRRHLENAVEKLLEDQIREILVQQDIFGFPPVNLRLGELPRLLVISPRDRIESTREIMLLHDISLEDIEDIEARADQLGVSSLVVELGGYGGTYPSFVTNGAGLRATIDTAAEEWIHQYLAFKPLGFRYVLDLVGLERNYEIATINETIAGMVSEEIGLIVRQKYYPGQTAGVPDRQEDESDFDFDREMREIRLAVDEYLARGEIELAEEFMEQKRQDLAAQGHYIRKLNQAYFAWHGTYADDPAFVSPIGVELKELRAQSSSLKDFLATVSGMTSREDLRESIGSIR